MNLHPLFLQNITLHTKISFFVLLINTCYSFQSATKVTLGQTRYFPSSNTIIVHRFSMTSASASDPVRNLALPSPIILGSGSFTRKLILREMNIDFVIKVKPIDEKSIGQRKTGSDPRQLVLTLAKAKAETLTHALIQTEIDHHDQECVVLTADQVVTHNGEILEKPESHEQAIEFVHKYAHMPPATVGSVVLTHIPSMTQVAGVDISHIHFRPSIATCDLIPKLVQDGAPVLDCAGGLMIEHPLVQQHLDHIDGSVDGVMGLSKALVLQLLQELKQSLNTIST